MILNNIKNANIGQRKISPDEPFISRTFFFRSNQNAPTGQ